jgi:hypothetical protein
MSPSKYSPQIALPPIFSGDVEVSIRPLTAIDATCVPFTNMRSVVPSYVAARWVQAPVGMAAVPFSTRAFPPIETCDSGRLEDEFA